MKRPPASAADVLLLAVTYWYLTGVLVAVGFSFGFYFARLSSANVPQTRDPLDALAWMDGGWYKRIVTDGYQYDRAGQSNIAFFPAYPLLGRAVMIATDLRAEIALSIASNLSWLGALAVLAFYVRARFPEAPTELADYTLLAAALTPAGCFFRLNYSESTFLLFSVLALFAMARRWPLWGVSLIVGLATAVRPVGVALLIPLAIHIVRAPGTVGAPGTTGASRWAMPTLRAVAVRLALYLPLACWGVAAFMAYQYRVFGDPLVAFKAHEHWRIVGPVPWDEKLAALVALGPVRSVYDPASPAYWRIRDTHGVPWFSLQFANPIFFLTAIGLVALAAWRRWLLLEELLLSGLLLLIPYSMRGYEMGMGSMARFVAVVFPLYIVAGRMLLLLPGPLRALALALSGLPLAAYTALYAAGYEIF